MKRQVVACLVVLTALSARGFSGGISDLELLDGRVIKGITACHIDGEKVRLVHEGGVERIHFSKFTVKSRNLVGIKYVEDHPNNFLDFKELSTVSGKSYKGVRAVKVRPSHLAFVHETGAASVRFDDLTEEMQRKFRYDPVAAKSYDEARSAAEKAIEEEERRIAKMEYDAKQRKEIRRRRSMALSEIQMTTIGSNRYWMGDRRERDFQDTMIVKHLTNSGFSYAEAVHYLNMIKFR